MQRWGRRDHGCPCGVGDTCGHAAWAPPASGPVRRLRTRLAGLWAGCKARWHRWSRAPLVVETQGDGAFRTAGEVPPEYRYWEEESDADSQDWSLRLRNDLSVTLGVPREML